MLVSLLTVFFGGGRVLLGLVMLTDIVMMGRLMVVVRGGGVMGSRLMMRLMRGMMLGICHDEKSFSC